MTVPNALVVRVQKMAEAAIGYDLDLEVPLDDQGFDSIDRGSLGYDLECEFDLEDDAVLISDTCTILSISGKLT